MARWRRPCARPTLIARSGGCSLNSLVSGVTSSFLWFALTFWVYLETRSVVVTGVIGGAFSISAAVLGPAFGTYVDRHRKQPSMVLATTITHADASSPPPSSSSPSPPTTCCSCATRCSGCSPGSRLLGSVAGQMRSIAMSTCVTLLVPDERRDRPTAWSARSPACRSPSRRSSAASSSATSGWAGRSTLSLVLTVDRAACTCDGIHVEEPEPAPARRRVGARHRHPRRARRRSAPCPG